MTPSYGVENRREDAIGPLTACARNHDSTPKDADMTGQEITIETNVGRLHGIDAGRGVDVPR